MTAGTLTICGVRKVLHPSIMPGYKWLFDNEPLDISDIEAKKVMQTLAFHTLMLKLLMLKAITISKK
jgi:cbb3-type cytochrome oxidase cytochrome c subunit